MKTVSQVLLSSPHAPRIIAMLNRGGSGSWTGQVTEDQWAKLKTANHLEPGVVKYDQEDGTSRTYLLTREAIAAMRPTAEGKPIVGKAGDFNHKDVKPSDFTDGKADGVVIESFDGDDGWEKIRFMVWDDETKKKCSPEGYQISCAYVPGKIEEKPGLWHNVPYDAIILDGSYTHFAVVPNPRYEGAVIFANSLKGGNRMFNLLFGGKTVELDKETKIVIDGKETPLSELVNALMATEAAKAKVTTEAEAKNALTDDKTVLEVNGKKVTLGELKAAHKRHLKNAMDEDEAKKNADEEAKKKADESAKNAADEESKKKADAEKANADAEAKKKAEDEAKNADPECAYKIKQNAEGSFDILDKAGKNVCNAPTFKHAKGLVDELHGEDKRNADEMSEKARLAEEAKGEHFNALRKAARSRRMEEESVGSGISTPVDKEDLGRERYGSPVSK